MDECLLNIIYLRSGSMLLSRKLYRDWREIQDEFEDYQTSLGPWSISEVLEFLQWDYPALMTEGQQARITQFIESEEEQMELFA